MNRIDIFLELLDADSIYNICKSIKIPVKNRNNYDFNKIRLKQQFKSGSKSFNRFVVQNKDDTLSELNETEFLIFLRYYKSKMYPDHVKFVNFLNYFPVKSAEMLAKIEENINQNRSIFDFGIAFNKSDIVDFFQKSYNVLNDNSIEYMINKTVMSMLKLGLVSDDKIDIREIENYDLEDLLKSLEGLSLGEKILSKHYYIQSHKIDEPLYSRFLLNIHSEIIAFLNPYIGRIKDMNGYEELVKKNKELNSNIRELENHLRKEKNTNKKLQKDMEGKLGLEEIIKDNKKQMDKYKAKLEELEDKHNKLIEDAGVIRELNREYRQKIEGLTSCIDIFTNDPYNRKIAVISNLDRYELKVLYGGEILFLTSEQADNRKLLNFNKGVSSVLIERRGINSSDIRRIKRQLNNHQNIRTTIINPSTNRELLEEIIIEKMKLKGDFKDELRRL